MTKISDLLGAGRTYSFEFFPPKTETEQATLLKTLQDLVPLSPSFVSVTYRGGRESRQRTYDLVTSMLETTPLVPMAHLICVAHSKAELVEILESYASAGVENLMALGGDPPEGECKGLQRELLYAQDLVELARTVGGFSIGVAAHPLGHPTSPNMQSDRDYLSKKLSCADFGVTQFFFECVEYERLCDDLLKRGVAKPVVPGILPVTSLSTLSRLSSMGAPPPLWLTERLSAAERRGGAEAVRKEGIEIFSELCGELLAKGAPGLHFFTFNRSKVTMEIYSALGLSPR